MRAAIYVRISNDPTGLRAGVERQRDDCQQLCVRNGWDIAGVFEDNDMSAYSGKPRPGWDAVWDTVAAGKASVIVAWHPDRMYRRMKELVRITDLVEEHGVQIETVTAGEVDLSTPDGRFRAHIEGAVAEKSSADTSRRVSRWHRSRAESGRPPGGGTRAFGYDRQRVDGETVWTVRPEEHRTFTEVVERLLTGEAAVAICRDLNERGIYTSTGATWTARTLRRMVLSPTVAALREVDGRLVEGRWPPLVDRVTWERVRAAVESRSFTRAETSGYCLSGALLRCGRCGRRMYGHKKGEMLRYACRRRFDGGSGEGCGSVSITARPLENYVRDALMETVDWNAVQRRLTQRDDDQSETVRELQRIEQQMDELADDYTDGRVSRDTYLRAARRMEARQETLKGSLRATQDASLATSLPPSAEAFEEKWETSTPSWRRRVVELWIDTVTVHPASVGGRRFNPERVSIRWRA